MNDGVLYFVNEQGVLSVLSSGLCSEGDSFTPQGITVQQVSLINGHFITGQLFTYPVNNTTSYVCHEFDSSLLYDRSAITV